MSPVFLGYLIGVVAVGVVSMIGLEVRRQTRREFDSTDFNDPGASVLGGIAFGAAWPAIAAGIAVVGIVGGLYYVFAGKLLKGSVSLVLRKTGNEVPKDQVVVKESLY